jgi:hypothetical protein
MIKKNYYKWALLLFIIPLFAISCSKEFLETEMTGELPKRYISQPYPVSINWLPGLMHIKSLPGLFA